MGSHASVGRRAPLKAMLAATMAIPVALAMIASSRSPDTAYPVAGPHHVGVETSGTYGDRPAERPVNAETPSRATNAQPRAARTDPVDSRWGRVLRILDRRRARAFEQGEPRLLDGVYLDGSPARAVDAETIEAYAGRGLRITGLRMRILSLIGSTHGPGDVRLIVLDRIDRAVAVDSQQRRVQLPRDRPTSHRLVVERTPQGWRIASIR
jgi:hypothetical protein